MDLKEAAANALQHDPDYAYRSIQSVEVAQRVEDFAGELTYPAFEAELNTTLRNIKKSTSLRNKFNSMTERWQADGKGRIKSLRLLWMVYDHLNTHPTWRSSIQPGRSYESQASRPTEYVHSRPTRGIYG